MLLIWYLPQPSCEAVMSKTSGQMRPYIQLVIKQVSEKVVTEQFINLSWQQKCPSSLSFQVLWSHLYEVDTFIPEPDPEPQLISGMLSEIKTNVRTQYNTTP